jgi:hypothetical protein
MPYQKGLLWRPRPPSLLKYLFIVMTVYSSNVGGEGSFGTVREVACRALGLKTKRELYEEMSTKTGLRVVVHLAAVSYFRFRHSQGGTGCGSTHKPFCFSRASFSTPSSTVSPGAYFRYHQHQPCLTSS